MSLEPAQRVGPVGGNLHPVTVVLKLLDQDLREIALVVDDEDRLRSDRCSLRRLVCWGDVYLS